MKPSGRNRTTDGSFVGDSSADGTRDATRQLASLGIVAPRSSLATDAEEAVRDAAPPYLFNHSIRSYAFAVVLGDIDERRFDPDLLYVAALFHDLGLLRPYDLGGCFEVDGAAAASAFTARSGVPKLKAAGISAAIAEHMAPTMPTTAEAALLWDATGTDVLGWRLNEVPSDLVTRLIEAFPRLQFKRQFTDAFVGQAARKPRCRAAEKVAEGMVKRIADAPFAE